MKAILFVLILALTGCVEEIPKESITAADPKLIDYKCLDGVTYVRYSHGMSVKLGRDSKIIPCSVTSDNSK